MYFAYDVLGNLGRDKPFALHNRFLNNANLFLFSFSSQLAMSLKNLGRDARFALDDRFLDDDNVEKPTEEENDGDDLKNEAKWQLGILENVLGKPFKAREENTNSKRQNKMIRYDPTASGHREHELEVTTKPAKAKKGKPTTIQAEPEEQAPVVVSSDVFYSVSENLTESLKAPGEFSLLATFGTAAPTDKSTVFSFSILHYGKKPLYIK